MRRTALTLVLATVLLAVPGGTALAGLAAEERQTVPVRLFAGLECTSNEDAWVTFTIRNIGKQTLRIDDDFHLSLVRVRPGGRELVTVVFVFPAPGFKVIAPGAQKTFLVPMDTGGEDDLSARRLIVGADVFFKGINRPSTRHFTFVGCND